MNHTSDQHPWFQASRSDPEGPYGDFYVWSDTDDRYTDARIIFVDTETSNWTFDPIRRQFFWHRFFSHQPDLNFENPAVHEAMFDVVRFWMDMGIDGFRLDAVPYLYEEEGHNGENHPKTHAFLAQLRDMVDNEYPGRILLAEANQPPGDVVDYFGTEEAPECQMCFHFPVMPMLYYALREEKAAPIIDVLADTPAIPGGAQWGTFLRNHDELTLEMVTPEQRAAMYGWYAPDPRMRANIGIRRRLAPLLDNSRPEIELIHALLLSLPGSPCLYYGDEIGMGDNIWLHDRDAVRTPMQWTPDRNAGFSTADPGKLYLPGHPVARLPPQPHQRRGPDGLGVLAAALGARHARRCAASTRSSASATSRCASPTHERVLAFTRVDRHARDTEDRSAVAVLCVNNLSSRPQSTTLRCPRSCGTGRRETSSAAAVSPTSHPTAPSRSPWGRATSSGSRSSPAAGAPVAEIISTATISPTKLELVAGWMGDQRWYAAKGRSPACASSRRGGSTTPRARSASRRSSSPTRPAPRRSSTRCPSPTAASRSAAPTTPSSARWSTRPSAAAGSTTPRTTRSTRPSCSSSCRAACRRSRPRSRMPSRSPSPVCRSPAGATRCTSAPRACCRASSPTPR